MSTQLDTEGDVRRTNRATAFSVDLCNELNRLSDVQKWEKNWKLGNSGYGTVDVAWPGGDGTPVVLVEAELRRKNPVSNVVKVWMWATKGKLNGRFLLVQAFSSHYKDSTADKARAKFVGKRMQTELGSRARYVAINFQYGPRKGGKVGAGCRQGHAKLLAKRILRRPELIPLRRMKDMRGCLRGIETSVERGRRHA
jgi:hypothetical protein